MGKGSNVILRYIADAPLRSLTTTYREKAGVSQASTQAPIEPAPISHEALQWDDREALQLADLMLTDNAEPEHELPNFAMNVDTNVVHLIVTSLTYEKPTALLGRVRCGWDYKVPNARLSTTLPSGVHRCGKCARAATWAAMQADDVADD